MRVVLQRVSHALVKVDGAVVGRIGQGLLLLVGFGKGDDEQVLSPMVHKLAHLRVFPDERGRFHYSVLEIGGGILAVPQFTLFADTSKGRRPEFFNALEPERASQLFDQFVALLREHNVALVQTGIFGAHMQVALENDGPVTILLEN